MTQLLEQTIRDWYDNDDGGVGQYENLKEKGERLNTFQRAKAFIEKYMRFFHDGQKTRDEVRENITGNGMQEHIQDALDRMNSKRPNKPPIKSFLRGSLKFRFNIETATEDEVKKNTEVLDRLYEEAIYFKQKKGPDPEDRQKLYELADYIVKNSDKISERQYIENFLLLLGDDFVESEMKKCLCREGGEAANDGVGNAERMRFLYENSSENKWDQAYQSLEGADAVRNRTDEAVDMSLKNVILEKIKNNENITIKDAPCGTSEYTAKIIEEIKDQLDDYDEKITILLRDVDEKTLQYAEKRINTLIQKYKISNKVEVDAHQIDLSKPDSDPYINVKNDTEYCGGLYDYLSPQQVAHAMRQTWDLLKKGGLACLGQFKENHPSQKCLEAFLNWKLKLRNKQDIEEIITMSGIPRENVDIKETYRSEDTQFMIYLRK